MTFPVVATVGYSEESVDTTTHDVVVPASIGAGDLLMLWAAIDDTTTEPSISGWSPVWFLDGAHVGAVYYKFAAGGETDFTYTTSVAQQSSNRTWRVTGAHASSPPEVGATGNNGFSSLVNPGTLSPTWGTDDTLWVVFGAFDQNPTVSAYPVNYTDNQFSDFSTGGSEETRSGLVLCSRNLTAATEDPDAGTLSASVNLVSRLFAIRPAVGSAGAGSVNPMGTMGFFGA